MLARRDRPTPPGVTFFTADLRTGQGIEPAVTAAAAIIHCATSTRATPGHTVGSRTRDQFLTTQLQQAAATA